MKVLFLATIDVLSIYGGNSELVRKTNRNEKNLSFKFWIQTQKYCTLVAMVYLKLCPVVVKSPHIKEFLPFHDVEHA